MEGQPSISRQGRRGEGSVALKLRDRRFCIPSEAAKHDNGHRPERVVKSCSIDPELRTEPSGWRAGALPTRLRPLQMTNSRLVPE